MYEIMSILFVFFLNVNKADVLKSPSFSYVSFLLPNNFSVHS